MRRHVATFAAMSALALALSASPALAGSPAVHSSFDAASPSLIVCGANTYKIVSGTLDVVSHVGTSASGNFNGAFTFTVHNVVVENQADHKLYDVVGAERYGGTVNAQTGGSQWVDYLFKFRILGTADSLNTIWRTSPSGVDSFFGPGNCTP
jgi:hypothetical protein